MKYKYLLLLLLSFALLISSPNVFAQNEDEQDKEDVEEDSIIEIDDDFDFEFDKDLVWFSGKPTIGVNYGFGKNSHKGFLSDFAKPNYLEVKFGYTTERNIKQSENVMRYKQRYLTLSDASNKLGKKAEAGEVELDVFKLGLGWADGYGYNWGKTGIIFYNANGFAWSRLKTEQAPTNLNDLELLNYYEDNFRIGTGMEGGIKFQIVPEFVLTASYERGAVYPRLLFWKAAGSSIIENIGREWVEDFVHEILDSSPLATPIVDFILMNGYSYFIYEFRKENMNFPFNTASPFMFETYKVGLSFIF